MHQFLFGDTKATERMIQLNMAHWEDPVNQYISRPGKLCENMVYERVLNVFGHHRNPQLFFDQYIMLDVVD